MPGCFRPKPEASARPGKQIIIAPLHQGHVAGSTSREKKIKYHLSFSGEFTGQVLRELSFSNRLFA